MNSKLYVAVYSLTLLLSASLLFVVQPMFSKMVLPLLGGTPQVWNTAMLFFQLLLLAGYAYAHLTTRLLTIRSQALLHLSLLLVFFFVLPIGIPVGSEPPVEKDPTLWQLSLMTLTIGGPFFVLSGCAPMLQRWFSVTNHKDAHNPYFLYGASNIGSMTALLLYPIIIEPSINLTQQSQSWMYSYLGLMILMAICALIVWKRGITIFAITSAKSKEIISWKRRGKWLLLAFIPSSLMLGVTTYITTDIASVPLFWIIPLALYLATFIIVFARKQIISETNTMDIFAYLLVGLLVYLAPGIKLGIVSMVFHLVLFFFAALVCHMALSSSKPSAEKLTEFYLMMSIGGALGGVFNALITPKIFILPVEYALVLGLAACMRFGNQKLEKPSRVDILLGITSLITFYFAIYLEAMWVKILLVSAAIIPLGLTFNKRWHFGILTTLLLLISPMGGFNFGKKNKVLYQDRNFFGVMRVIDSKKKMRLFVHGTTIHGAQSLEVKRKLTPLSYYGKSSPIADMFKFADQGIGKQKIAVLGLGVGVTACFYKKDRSFDFFEIDPGVIQIAKNPEYFTFLSDCGSVYSIIQGDARLKLAQKENNHYDFILADAFSSDNIPVHLTTLEAVALYLKKLKPEGMLGLNISNKYVDLEPILAKISNSLGFRGYAKIQEGSEADGLYPSHAFVITRNPKQEKFLQNNGWRPAYKSSNVELWTDQFSNIISAFSTNSAGIRMESIELMKKNKEGSQ